MEITSLNLLHPISTHPQLGSAHQGHPGFLCRSPQSSGDVKQSDVFTAVSTVTECGEVIFAQSRLPSDMGCQSCPVTLVGYRPLHGACYRSSLWAIHSHKELFVREVHGDLFAIVSTLLNRTPGPDGPSLPENVSVLKHKGGCREACISPASNHASALGIKAA